MENSARKLFAIIGILFLFIFAFIFTANIDVFADSQVSYLSYNISTKEFETQTLSNYTPIETTTDFTSGGTFVLDKDVVLGSIDSGSNDLTLILCDGKTLTVGSIKCRILTIYAQELGTGKIAASGELTTGEFICCNNDFVMHGGEITTEEYFVKTLILCKENVTIYNATIKGNVGTGINCYSNFAMENAVFDLTISEYGIYADGTFTIGNGIYNIDGATAGVGTVLYNDSGAIIVERGTFTFNNVEYGFYAHQELRINHGKINITAINNAFRSETKTIWIRGTATAHSEDYPVAYAAKTITVSYPNMLFTTNNTTRGVFYSVSVSTGSENAEYYYKDSEDGQWYQDGGKGPNSPSVKFLKVVPIYNHITVWVEDMSVEEGTDISSIEIPFSFGFYNNRDEETQEDYKEEFEEAALLVRVVVNCDGTTPGTYDYSLEFTPEYEGNIDDHYDIIFGNEIGHFIVTEAPASSTIETDPANPSTPQEQGTQETETQTTPEQQETSGVESKQTENSDKPIVDNEETICVGVVVIVVDIAVFICWIFVIIYLIHNKKLTNDKIVLASKIARLVGLITSICALVFAIVVIIMHQCVFSIVGIIVAAIVVGLFGSTYLIKFKTNNK